MITVPTSKEAGKAGAFFSPPLEHCTHGENGKKRSREASAGIWISIDTAHSSTTAIHRGNTLERNCISFCTWPQLLQQRPLEMLRARQVACTKPWLLLRPWIVLLRSTIQQPPLPCVLGNMQLRSQQLHRLQWNQPVPGHQRRLESGRDPFLRQPEWTKPSEDRNAKNSPKK